MGHVLAALGLAAGCVVWGLLMALRTRERETMGIPRGGCGGRQSCDSRPPEVRCSSEPVSP